MTAKCSTQERYMGARRSSNLRLVANNTGSADVLIAAGWVARASERKAVALAIAGVMSTERMTGANAVSDVMAGWLRDRDYKLNGSALPRVQARDLAMTVLKWWQLPSCPACGGHGHPAILNSPVLDESRECADCRGTGKIQMSRLVKPEFVEHARWLSNEIEVIYTMVCGQINRRLKMN